jgi:NADPH:quinone reductase-like Zn-dependent oxidoreductase
MVSSVIASRSEAKSRGDRIRTCDLRFWRPPLYQLSYAPVPAPVYRDVSAAKVARMAMTALFATLTAALAAVSVYALASGTDTRHILIGAAAGAVALWLASLARAAFRRRK